MTSVSLDDARFSVEIVAGYVAQGGTLKEKMNWCPGEVP